MNFLPRMLLAVTVPLAIAAPLFAHGYAKGNISIGHPWARETASGQSAGGGFLTITNKGAAVDKLVGGSTPVARQLQIHSMSMDGGIMRMRQMTDGLAIPAGSTVELKPGSYHLMFIGLNQPLKAGTNVPATLQFQHAGKVQVEFAVQSMTGAGSTGNMSAMDHGHAGH